MSTNYNQSVIIGIEIDAKKIEVIDSEEVSEMQSRYNPKTGKEISKEKVIIQYGRSHYEFAGSSNEDLYSLLSEVSTKMGLSYSVDTENDVAYLGIYVGEPVNFGNVDLIEGCITIEGLEHRREQILKKFWDIKLVPPGPILLHFIADAG